MQEMHNSYISYFSYLCHTPSTHQHINTSTHQYIHQYINTSIHTSIHRYINTYTSIRQYVNTSIRQYINTSIHQYVNTSIHQYERCSQEFKPKPSPVHLWQSDDRPLPFIGGSSRVLVVTPHTLKTTVPALLAQLEQFKATSPQVRG